MRIGYVILDEATGKYLVQGGDWSAKKPKVWSQLGTAANVLRQKMYPGLKYPEPPLPDLVVLDVEVRLESARKLSDAQEKQKASSRLRARGAT
jgi:hypothetical protein